MDLVENVDGSTVTLRVRGELDMATVPAFQTAALGWLAGDDCATLVIDLAAVSFVDSGGLTALVQLQESAARFEVTMVLTGVSRQTRKLMAVTSLTDMFTIV